MWVKVTLLGCASVVNSVKELPYLYFLCDTSNCKIVAVSVELYAACRDNKPKDKLVPNQNNKHDNRLSK